MLQSISGMRVCVLCTACSDRNIEKTVGHTGIARLCLTQWCHRTRTDGSLFAKGSPRLCRRGRMSRGYVILSGSMEPVIPTGSVAVVDSSKRDVRPGNIATFERHGDLVTHRILSKTEEGYQTKGDANTDPDSGTIPAENIRGTYLFCIPYLGYGFMWAKNHMFLTVGFLALFMLLVFCFPEKRPEPKEREQVKKTKRKKGELRL